MKRLHKFPAILAMGALGAMLAGCALISPQWVTQQFAIDPGPAPQTFANRIKVPGTISFVDVAPAFGGANFVYSLGGGEWETDPYNQFLIPPGEMFTGILRKWITDSAIFPMVALPGDGRTPGIIIETRVGELFGDFANLDAPEAVLSMEVQVFSLRGGVRTLMMEQRFETRTRVRERTPEALVEAWSAGLRGTLALLLRGLATRAASGAEDPEAADSEAEPTVAARSTKDQF